jgi:hypothetical protein
MHRLDLGDAGERIEQRLRPPASGEAAGTLRLAGLRRRREDRLAVEDAPGSPLEVGPPD